MRIPAIPLYFGLSGRSNRGVLSPVEPGIDRELAPPASAEDSGIFIAAELDEAAIRARHTSPWTLKQKIARVAWMLVWGVFFRFSFHNWYAWRRLLLRAFGAQIGKRVRIRPTAWIEIPWNLKIGDDAIVGDGAIIYSLAKISIGRWSIVSQYAHLCAGTHDYTSRCFDLVRIPISIGDDAWVGAEAFVGPGVVVGHRAVVGARSVVVSDVESDNIVAGHPARFIKKRVITH